MGTRLVVSVTAVALALGGVFLERRPHAPKLIQWGWDEPDTASLVRDLHAMEDSPFDGCVFSVRHGSPTGGGSFTWRLWGRRRFTREELAAPFADLSTLRPRRFRELFLRVNVTPGDVDWFEDYSSILSNLELAAELARVGRVRGVLLDVEQYEHRLFDFAAQPQASAQGWDAYAAQARLRGREVMAALQRRNPGLTVFLTFGHSLPFVMSEGGRRPLAETSYGLLAPFLDGLVETARGSSKVIDGFELSYGFRDPSQFTEARRLVEEAVMPIVAPREAYRKRVSLGFGLWLDYDWRRQGWHPAEPARNYFTPAGFETALRAALETTDEYVWLYAENPRWWGPLRAENEMSRAYADAVRRAQTNELQLRGRRSARR